MEIIKFKPTNYEYVEGIHCVEFQEENFVWISNQPNSLTWGNRSVLRIQMNSDGKIINKRHSFYFQLADGTKKIFKVEDLMENSDLEERLIKYLVDYENEYLFNLMQESETDNDTLKTLQKAYEEVEQKIYKTAIFLKDDKVTKVKEHEINELIFEIEQMNLENAINKALDENDKESFMKLTGGIE